MRFNGSLCIVALAVFVFVSPALSGAGTVGAFIVAEGLSVESFATDQLSNPASIDVDDRGRVWVAEALNYRKKFRKEGVLFCIKEDDKK